jgi:4-amino-4-deoxy-L-arabinose transferase-like glycosyltransferase
MQKVPALWPSFSSWIRPTLQFSWKRVLERESLPMALVGLAFFVSELMEGALIEDETLLEWVSNEPHWTALLLASVAPFLWRAAAPAAAGGQPSALGKVERIFAWLTASHFRAVCALAIASFALFAPGFSSLPVTSRDESRFAQPARQMVESGDYIDIRLQDAPRYRKPIGIYWLQAGTVKLAERLGVENARNRIEIYRIPSLLAAIGSVLLTYWVALAFVSRRYAILAGLMLAASSLLGLEARIATIDASMLLASTASFGALAHLYLRRDELRRVRRQGWLLAGVFWTGLAASALLKGPIIATLVALTIATLAVRDRSVRWLLDLKPVAGVVWTAVLCLPWYLAIYFQTRGAFFETSVSLDLRSRLITPAEGHWGPPGYFWLLFWVCFWPAAALMPPASRFAWITRADPKIFFLIAWLVPNWVLFEVILTKLPHYVLPLYPGVAILIACMLEKGMRLDLLARSMGLLWPGIAIALSASILVLAFEFDHFVSPLVFALIVVAVVAASYAALQLFREKVENALALALLTSIAMSGALYGAIGGMKSFAVSRELVAASAKATCGVPRLASVGYHEPNLIFYGGTDIALASAGEAARFLQSESCRVVFVEARMGSAFAAQAQAHALDLKKIGDVKGFDYSNWRHVSFEVLTRR